MRVIAYIDGYNLFYGRLSKTAHKWLNVVALCDELLPRLFPTSNSCELVKVRYYTSPIKRAFSTAPDTAPTNQSDYLNALKFVGGARIELYRGRFNSTKFLAYDGNQAPSNQDRPELWVWKLEEKRVDVKLSIDLYRDALSGDVGGQVIVSNDEDLAPALEAVSQDFPHVTISLVPPSKKRENGTLVRPPNSRLTVHVNGKTIPHIADRILKRCQLPDPVRTPKKHIHRPTDW